MGRSNGMSDFHTIDDDDNIWLRKDRKRPRIPTDDPPWGTYACITVCVGFFLLIIATGGPHEAEGLAYVLYPELSDIWNGAYWGPLTSSFVHFAPMHILFNLYWLWHFGRAIERHFGTPCFLALVIASGFLSASCQIAFSDANSIGASGINYGLFGFLWVARYKSPELETVVPDRIVKFMMVWLVLCFFLSKAGIWPVANAAHTSGLIIGALAAAGLVLRYKRHLTVSALALMTALLFVPLFYVPWSYSWNWNQGYNSAKEGRYNEAIHYYVWVLKQNPGDKEAKHNLELARNALAAEQMVPKRVRDE